MGHPTSEELEKAPFRSLFTRNEETDVAEIIFNYFKAVQEKWPKAWEAVDRKGNLLPKTNAFRAFMRYLRQDVYPEIANGDHGYIPKKDEFKPYLNGITLSDEEFTTSKFVPGSGGESKFLKLLRGEISKEDIIDTNP